MELRKRIKLLECILSKVEKISFVENIDMDGEVERFANAIRNKISKLHLDLILREILTEEEYKEVMF